MLVRHLMVSKAHCLLKLNYIDYYDCEISEKNLASYPEDGPPVVVGYYPSSLWCHLLTHCHLCATANLAQNSKIPSPNPK